MPSTISCIELREEKAVNTIDTLASPSARINLPTLVRYLRLNDWRELQHPSANIRVFGHDIENSEEPATVVIPERRALADFSTRVLEAIQVIAQVQQQPIHRVLDAVLYATYDVIRARLLDRGEKISSIPLDMASRAIEHLRNFVASSACTKTNPRPFFPKATALARDFAELSTIRSNLVGSFGFTIECPIAYRKTWDCPKSSKRSLSSAGLQSG